MREAIGDKFPKHIYHSIVCIDALIVRWESDHWAVDAVGAPHVGKRTEKQLITAFCDKIAELSPQLVTFNGNSFDLPVLRYRAMVHGISAPGLSARPYFNRYTEDAIDLCDVLSSFSPQGKATLHEISRIMGLPGKPKGFDGGEVERYFREGKIKEVVDARWLHRRRRAERDVSQPRHTCRSDRNCLRPREDKLPQAAGILFPNSRSNHEKPPGQ
jgi:3'-5' exonuclease